MTTAPAFLPGRAEAVRTMWASRAVMLAILVAFFSIPGLPWVNDSREFLIAWAMCSALVGMSMNVLAGYAGQISLAQAVIFGTGAFAMGNLVTNAGVPWLVALPLAGIITSALTLVIGFPALRIRGLHLAIATLGFQFMMARLLFRSRLITGGTAGIDIERPVLFGVDLANNDQALLWVILSVFAIIWMVDRNLTRTRAGRAFFAVRQDEQVAASFGIPVARYKLLAFAISGFYAGIAGALFGTLQQDVSAELFDFIFSIEFLVFAVLGGLGSRAGTAIGAAFPVMYRNILSFLATTGALIGGLLLVGTLLRYEGGIAAQGRELGENARALYRRGHVYGVAFLGALTVTIAAAVGLPYAIWAAGLKLTTFPNIIIGLGTGVTVSLLLEKRIRAAAMRPPTTADRALVSTLAAIGSIVGVAILVFAIRYLLDWAFDVEAGSATLAWIVSAIGAGALAAFLLRQYAGDHGPVAHAPPLAAQQAQPVLAAPTLVRRPAAREPYRGPLLDVRDLAMHFGGVRALDGVSLEVRAGELIGIMGPNGSGKTTMLNCISGFLTPTSGDVRYRGRSVNRKAPHVRAALGIGRTFQHVGLVKSETVADNFVIAQHLECRYPTMLGLLRTTDVIEEEARLKARASAVIDMLGLGDIRGERVSALPHGRAKLVELGCALVTGPELLLLDEPAAGVGPQEADALGESLQEIARQFGVTILMIEHHVPLMLSTCDYIYVLNFGQLLTHGEPAEVSRHPDVIAAYLGTTGKEASVAATGG
ncbi:MAG TPA: branched-chain amino acid ABC transporter ATP-binding protein/permease [Actinomycetota bacterium]